MAIKSNVVPAQVLSMLNAADKRQGFPPGTMASVMQQEIGGNLDKYLSDPTAYHYQAGADGRRIAPQSGKPSSAFGPFGLLESTAADPGYGVAPLKDKSLEEQVRFASDYLAGRSKAAGGLEKGLAGYGEGTKYAKQVLGRGVSPLAQPDAVVAAMPAPPVQQVPMEAGASAPVQLGVSQPLPAGEVQEPVQAKLAAVPPDGFDPWQAFLKGMTPDRPQPINVNDLQFGQVAPAMQVPNFQAAAPQSARPNFQAFGNWGRKVA